MTIRVTPGIRYNKANQGDQPMSFSRRTVKLTNGSSIWTE